MLSSTTSRRITSAIGMLSRQDGGDDDEEHRAFARAALQPDPSAQKLGEALAQRQTQAGATQALLQRRVDLGEILEQLRVHVLGDADAGVLHRETHFTGT